MQMCEKTQINASGWWMRSRWECALYDQGVKGRKGRRRRRRRCSAVENKNTTNPKQNADGSCADWRLSALWRALLPFHVGIIPGPHPSLPPSLPLYHPFTRNPPPLQAPISPGTSCRSLPGLCSDHFHRWVDAAQHLYHSSPRRSLDF